jgi:hypothetical protein
MSWGATACQACVRPKSRARQVRPIPASGCVALCVRRAGDNRIVIGSSLSVSTLCRMQRGQTTFRSGHVALTCGRGQGGNRSGRSHSDGGGLVCSFELAPLRGEPQLKH